MDNTLKPLPLLSAGSFLAAFGTGLFFTGTQDILYAPAVGTVLAAVLVAVLPGLRTGFTIPVTPVAAALFALWLYVTLSLTWSTVPYASLVTYLVFAVLPLTFFGIALSPARESLVRATAGALACATGILALWALAQVLLFSDTFGPRAHHPLQNPNSLAALFVLALPPALGTAWTAPAHSPRLWIATGFAALLFAGLLATGGRGALVAGMLAAVPLVFTLRGAPGFAGRATVAGGVGVALLAAALLSGPGAFAMRIANLADPLHDPALRARLSLWRSAWEMIRAHPLTGTGLGTFYLYAPAVRLPGPDNSTGSWAHADPLQYAVEMGPAAAFLFYALCAAAVVQTVRALRILPPGAAERGPLAGLSCGLLALALHAHGTFDLYILPILIAAGVALALWQQLCAAARPVLPAFRALSLMGAQKAIVGAAVLGLCGLMALMAASSAAGQFYLRRAHSQIENGRPESFTAAIAQARRWAPRSFIEPDVHLAAFYTDLLGAQGGGLFTDGERAALYADAHALLDAAQSVNPAWAEIDYQRGRLYAAAPAAREPAAPAKEAAALEEALRKNPLHARARQALARLYFRQGKVERAAVLIRTGQAYPHMSDVETAYTAFLGKTAPLLAAKRAWEEAKEKDTSP